MFEDEEIKYAEREIDGKIYVKVARSDEIYDGKGYKFAFEEDDDMQIAVFRVKGKLYCLHNICPHRHGERIYEAIIYDNLTIACPLHFWTYSLETGENINQKQGIKGLRKFDVFEENGEVWAEKPQYAPPKWRAEK